MLSVSLNKTIPSYFCWRELIGRVPVYVVMSQVNGGISHLSHQPVVHNWCSKASGMYYPVCGMVHIQYPMLPTQFCTKRVMLMFITYHLSFEYHGIHYTNTISNQLTGIYWHIKQHYDTNGIQDFRERDVALW